jgi:hypothetical protein
MLSWYLMVALGCNLKQNGLDKVAKDFGIDLYSFDFIDASENRVNWYVSNPASLVGVFQL